MPILEGEGFVEVKNRLSSVRALLSSLHTCWTAYSHKFQAYTPTLLRNW